MSGKLIISFIIGAICVCSISAQSNVVSYNSDQFDTQLANHQLAMVAFYAPWCHYSQDMLPQYDAASLRLASIPQIKLIKIDCWTDLKDEAKCQSVGILGFPTMKIYKYGQFYKEYTGARKENNIVTEMYNVINGRA